MLNSLYGNKVRIEVYRHANSFKSYTRCFAFIKYLVKNERVREYAEYLNNGLKFQEITDSSLSMYPRIVLSKLSLRYTVLWW